MKTKPELAAARVRQLCPLRPALALVLGSGFGGTVSEMAITSQIPFHRIPGMPHAAVQGHAGMVLIGRLRGTAVIVLQGRAHFYEGHSLATVTFPMRVLAELGVRAVLLTNAAGGINARFRPGDFMRLKDHINFMVNPLVGQTGSTKTRFVDLTQTYDPLLNRLLEKAAAVCQIRLRRGVYLAVSGPSYETPAECCAFARLGADAVGMSTVPEAIVARQCGLAVAGLSCITNLASCHAKRPLSHAEVLAVAERLKARAARLVANFAQLYGKTAEND